MRQHFRFSTDLSRNEVIERFRQELAHNNPEGFKAVLADYYIAIFIGLMLGVSQMMLKKEPWAFYVLLFGLIALLYYCSAGQSIGSQRNACS